MNITFTHECPVCGYESESVSMLSMFVDGKIVCPQCGYDGPDDEDSVNEYLKTLDNSTQE
jgi:hypothetical protein